MKKKLNKKLSNRILRGKLHKSYLDLLCRTFTFIKNYYLKTRNNIHPKRDPEIYGSLVYECSLTDLKKKDNLLYKLFYKFQTCEFYEEYFISQELLKLLFLPSFHEMEHYLLIQHHILDNGAEAQIDLKDFFNYVHSELKNYFENISKTYKLSNISKIEHLNQNIKIINQHTKEYKRNRLTIKKIRYQNFQQIKHQSMAIQLVILKAISLSESKKEIKILCDNLNSFLFKCDELFCGYV